MFAFYSQLKLIGELFKWEKYLTQPSVVSNECENMQIILIPFKFSDPNRLTQFETVKNCQHYVKMLILIFFIYLCLFRLPLNVTVPA